ncbi:MFS transporter [Nocardia sp. CDC159]|uniref:MFS transporter n=1 Tax=Nocardia pulmonis TaxID=2951408 RepID=A0A9X2EFL2_9NOCA|nr:MULTISPECIES: MFS transporter [Nocardia]MCM6778575.1 MFS transporter [Nocardia pulmonis]MCM6791464.1 MFS transporter [Nocardia sp. CDC159]
MTSDREPGAGSWGELFGRGHRGTSVVLGGGVLLYATNVYVTASLLPTAVRDIGGERFFAWNATAYLIASVVASMLVGKALSARGAVGAYLIACTIFIAGTLVCAAAPEMAVLLGGRAIQGFGGGMLSGLGFAVIRSTYPTRLWTRASGLVSGVWGLGAFAGPALGGAVAQFGPWRLAFLALAAVTVPIAVAVPYALPRGQRSHAARRIPVGSLVLLGTAAAAVSVIGILPRGGWTVAAALGALGAVLAFLATERRTDDGVLPAATFARGSALKWLYLTIFFIAIGINVEIFIPMFGQRLAGLAPLAAGFVGAAMSLGWTVGQVGSAGASRARTIGRLRVAGPATVALGLILTAAIQLQGADGPIIAMWVVTLFLAGTGIGAAFPHLTAAVMGSTADPARGQQAAAAIGTVQSIASTFGAAYAGVLVNLGAPSTVHSARYLLLGMGVAAAFGVPTALLARRRAICGTGSPAPQPIPAAG